MLRFDEIELPPLFRGRPFQGNLIEFDCRATERRGKTFCLVRSALATQERVLRCILCFFLIFLSAQSDLAYAGTIRISPNLGVTESYTDNVRSVSEGAEGDLITETRAGANFLADGNRLDLNLDVTGINERHLDTNGLNGSRAQILGNTTVEAWQDHFFIDSSVSMSEVSTTRDGAVSARDRALPSNRTNLLLYEVAPRLEHRVGRWLEAAIGYSHSESRFSKPTTGISTFNRDNNQKTDRFSADLSTGQRFSVFKSQLQISNEETKGRRQKETEDRIDLLNEYQWTRQVALIVRAGYEDLSGSDRTLATSGPTWALGTHLRPGPRLDFRIEAGRKYDAGNVSANLSYKIGSFYLLNMAFSQAVQTQQQDRLRRLNRLITGPDGTLIDPFTGAPRDPLDSSFDLAGGSFKEDLFELGFSGSRGRNQMGMTAEFSSRESNAGTRKEDNLDLSLDFSRKLWRNLTGNVGATYSDTISSNKIEGGDTRYIGDASLDYRLGEIFSTSLEYSLLRRMPDSRASTSENIVSLGLRANF
jgi:uncharacterized protein (PEP-CTERM system associated)